MADYGAVHTEKYGYTYYEPGGSDTYVFDIGSGHDTIFDQGGGQATTMSWSLALASDRKI
jgi:hypothetical protein